MGRQWAVVYFANDLDQTMTEAAGPFRSLERAKAVVEVLDEGLHRGACPQIVALVTVREALDATP